MYEDLVKQLRYCADATTCRHCPWRSECCLHDAHRKAADAIEDLSRRVPPIPHGRLIDADAIADIFNMACAECKESCMEFDGVYADCDNCIFFGVKESFLNAPTVIEAEGET